VHTLHNISDRGSVIVYTVGVIPEPVIPEPVNSFKQPCSFNEQVTGQLTGSELMYTGLGSIVSPIIPLKFYKGAPSVRLVRQTG
jgi:hypothetical protein